MLGPLERQTEEAASMYRQGMSHLTCRPACNGVRGILGVCIEYPYVALR